MLLLYPSQHQLDGAPAPSWACRSGPTSATAWACPARTPLTCPTSSGCAQRPPERHRLLPLVRRAFSPSARHPDAACRCLLGSLFAEPGLHRTALVGRIVEYAGVSRSTAERVLRRVRAGGHIVDRPAGRRVRYFLSERAFADCLAYFRTYMDGGDGRGRPGGRRR